ncbi:hypothetical protein DEU56DRAFT_158195 [Suillus clintonianus]|uniref:uncharacterized protein n=1 Tax=Suillus clintonianus TaxID=1904413 RepID=UPI001B88666E|nr:uncharacterized protein DEU56DRAFT_158195 [Suillus clintonianus]KAG2117712.1 hypothetical protein DEU56DRAFT_158195 [Suillus clintonianus]
MLSTRLIRKLLKRLWQILATLTTSSAQRLRILMACLRRFVAKVHVLLGHITDSKSSTADSYCAGASSARYPQATLPLPITSGHGGAANGTQDATSSSTPFAMPVPCIPQQNVSPYTSSPARISNAIPSNAARTTPHFEPFAANDVLRYDKHPHADKSSKCDRIPELMRCFPNKSCPWLNGDDWQLCIHPEGALYLYNENQKTFTEAIMDQTTFQLLAGCVNDLYNLAHAKSAISQTSDIELVVQLWPAEGGEQAFCQYYFADHAARTLFWLHDHEQAAKIFSGLRGVHDPSHIRYALESEYWTHCERYPNHQMDRVKLLKELRENVMYASAEILTSDMSLSPFDADELFKILELINHLQENAEGNDFPHSKCIIARFMHYFYITKYFNFCGLPYARLDADRSVYEEDTSFHPLISTLSLLFEAMLFWAPQAHLKDIRRVWVDECINTPRWKDFNRNLMTEWSGITIYSTVMLAVDVSFLAVPNVNISQSQSIGIIATYLSIIFITGSLVASVLLARQNQRYGFESADKAAEFLSNLTGTFFGVKALATVHSLPYAMLMWGMIYFAIGLLYNVFKSTTTAMLASVVSGSVVITMFILWFIWAAREIHIFKRLAKLVLSSLPGRDIQP